MASEIERKFLVVGDGWKAEARAGKAMRQAYLAATDRAAVRVRIVDDASATVTIKSAVPGLVRSEFEYAIPLDDARELLNLRKGRLLEKRRYIVPAGKLRWEIDVFSGELTGLIVAEIELPSEDADFARPSWLGPEITGDRRYYNADLAANGMPV